MERPPGHQNSTFYVLTEVEESAPRESDQMYWGRQLDRLGLTACNERLGEVPIQYDS